jgi:predicted RNA-binding Zn-ribbon protein involved in translation (DUF1610 family)
MTCGMESQNRDAPVRSCPVCRTAMIASKSKPERALFDTFNCLNCGTVVTLPSDRKAQSGRREKA